MRSLVMPTIILLVAIQCAKADSTTRLDQLGPHSQRILTQESDAKGQSRTKTVIQVETGLNYQDESGEWAPSEADEDVPVVATRVTSLCLCVYLSVSLSLCLCAYVSMLCVGAVGV
jgi:hypothetical protein